MTQFSVFRSDARGNVALTFALSSVALVAAVGGGLEITRVVDGKSKLQASLDAAALAAAELPAGTSTSARTTAAQKIFDANMFGMPEMIAGTATFTPDYSVASQVRLAGEVRVNTVIGKNIFGQSHLIKAESTAGKDTPASPPPPNCPAQPNATTVPAQSPPPPVCVSPPPPPPPVSPPPPPSAQGCVWALGTGMNPNGFLFNSGNTINAPNCQFHGHGTGNASVMWNSGNAVTLNRLFTKGSITANGSWQSWFQPNAGSAVANDPYPSGLPQPLGLPCTYNNHTPNQTSSGLFVLYPGVYCGSTNINANGATVRLEPGLYVIRGGDFNVNGGHVRGTGGVTIFHETRNRFALNGTSSFHIAAPTIGTYAGLALYDRYGLSGSTDYYPIDAGGGMNIQGIVYLPTRHLTLNSGSSLQSNSVRIIGNTVNFSGTNWNLTAWGASTASPPPPPSASPPPPPVCTAQDPVSLGTGLVTNGSFETPDVAAGGHTNYSSITGWTTTRWFEIGQKTTASDGMQYAEIEGDLSTTVTLTSGTKYLFSFDYLHADNGSSADNRIEVLWNGEIIARVYPVAGEPWKRISFPVVGPPSVAGLTASVPLTFRQMAGGNVNHGAHIDRVRVVQDDTVTLPPAGCVGGPPPPPPPPPSPLRILK